MLAFWDGESKGTNDVVSQALMAGKIVILEKISEDETQ